jgi:hypothetical protein
MTRTERLTERAITFALAEADEDLAVARLTSWPRAITPPWTRRSMPA